MSEHPRLGRELVLSPAFAARRDITVPSAEMLALPEKGVQFGTGAFLRGFVDYFIDEANRRGMFGGRLVAVASTGSGRPDAVNSQDGLHTLVTRGIEDGVPRQDHRVIGSVSRALSAQRDWDAVLALARRPEIEVVFSNTTEIGITLDEGDDPSLAPPRSFPGKLTRFLLERGRHFDYDPTAGITIVPCELIEHNGDRLRQIVLALAARWKLGPELLEWIDAAVPFCNTLVDRIVPGAPDHAASLGDLLGYRDDLLTVCEPYRLFAIEGDGALAARLRFPGADPAVIVTPDIRPYRERKVRLLNGTHTISTPVALLCGCETVREAVGHELVGRFIRRVMLEEIVPALDVPGSEPFARDVLDRFANPFIRHALFDITFQGTAKMRVRLLPVIAAHIARSGRTPSAIAFGFAAYLLFMRGDCQTERRGEARAVPADDHAARLAGLWSGAGVDGGSQTAVARLVHETCEDRSLWGADLTELPGFASAVTGHLCNILRAGTESALEAHLAAATTAT